MTRILGIDPGSRTTGFGVIEIVQGKPSYLTSGCIRAGDGLLPERLKTIFSGVTEIIEQFQPQELAIEQVFVRINVDSALKLGQARGAAICAAVMQNLLVSEYAPTRIKQAVVGKGHANKEQVQFMVRAMLNLPGLPQQDAADALACALCHYHSRDVLAQLKEAAL